MRENAFAKSRRLLVSGCVTVVRCDQAGVVALVKGDTGMHRVTNDDGDWHCDCKAVGMCSHGLATAAVVVTPGAWLEVVA